MRNRDVGSRARTWGGARKAVCSVIASVACLLIATAGLAACGSGVKPAAPSPQAQPTTTVRLPVSPPASKSHSDIFATSLAPGSAWNKVLEQVGPDGQVSLATALSAFAVAIGPVPGAVIPSGPRGPIESGTLAVSWVLGDWSQLSAVQRKAVLADLGAALVGSKRTPTSTTRAALAGPTHDFLTIGPGPSNPNIACPTSNSPAAAPYMSMWTSLKQTISGDIGASFTGNEYFVFNTVNVLFPKDNGIPSEAYTFPCNGGVQAEGAASGCAVHVQPAQLSGITPLRSVLAHELTHCLLLEQLGGTYLSMPAWYTEGSATWAETVIAGSDPIATQAWQKYLSMPTFDLFQRTYTGLGFFVHLAETGTNVWRRLIPIGQSFLANPDDNNDAWVVAGAGQDFLNNWGSGYSQGAYPGTAWTSSGPGLAVVTGNPQLLALTNGLAISGFSGPDTVSSGPAATEIQPLMLASAPPFVLKVTSSALTYGRISLGGTADATLSQANSKLYCVASGGGCTCPPGETLSASLTPMAPGLEYVTVTGGTVAASVTLNGMPMASVCHASTSSTEPPTTSSGPPGGGGGGGGPGETTSPAEQGCGTSGCAGGTGDVHLYTFGDLHYNFMAAGEFTAVRSTLGNLDIQVRQSPYPGSKVVSINTAIAMDVAGDRVGVYLTPGAPLVHVNGKNAVISTSQPLRLAHGGSLSALSADDLSVTWPDGSQVIVDDIGDLYLSYWVALATDQMGHVSGLLGPFDGHTTGTLLDGTGAPVANTDFSTLYPAYANSWRITGSESLFDYTAGQSTATFSIAGFPSQDVSAATAPGAAAAAQVCRSAGVTGPTALQDCTLDVALTGKKAFATGALDAQRMLPAARAPVPPTTVTTTPVPPTTAVFGSTGNVFPNIPVVAVSCPTTTWCMAIAGNEASNYSDGKWSAPVSADPLAPGESPYDTPDLLGVSCPTTTWCMAVASNGYLIYQNGSWGRLQPSTLLSISCTSPDFCAGAMVNGFGYYINGHWSYPGAGDGAGPISCTGTYCVDVWNGGALYTSTDGKVTENDAMFLGDPNVSCTSPRFCDVVVNNGPTMGASAIWTGSQLVPSRVSIPTSGREPHADVFQNAPGLPLSCVGTYCAVLVAPESPASAPISQLYTATNGAAWKLAGTVTTGTVSATALACPSSTECVIGDTSGSLQVVNPSRLPAPKR